MNTHPGTAHGRVEVLGNHTDYNRGLVLAMGVEYATDVNGSNRTDDRLFFKAKDFKESASRLLGVSSLCEFTPISCCLRKPYFPIGFIAGHFTWSGKPTG